MQFSRPLLKVPSFHHELTIKATHSGIVLLKQGRYRTRYTGSKTCVVDINGKLYEKRADFNRALANEVLDHPQKKSPRRCGQAAKGAIRSTGHEDNTISEPAKKNIRQYRVNKVEVKNRIAGMICTAKGKKELYFWTITFPPCIHDDLAYQAFNTWLTALRQKKMLHDYLWIAERQTGERKNSKGEGTNTIHFHLAIPHKMSVVEANRMMRITLTTFAKKNIVPLSVYQCKRYNGVDIAKNRNTRRVTNFAIKKGSRALSTYLTKYVTKNDTGFTHLAWHNSRGYSALFTGLTFTVPEFVSIGFHDMLIRKSVINNDFFMFFPWINGPPDKLGDHLAELNNYIQSLQN